MTLKHDKFKIQKLEYATQLILAAMENLPIKPVIVALCICFLLTDVDGASGIFFAKSYGDHMVLQGTPHRAIVWGFAHKIGDNVHLTLNNTEAATTTVMADPHGGSLGIWKAKLPVQENKGPFNIRVSSSEGSAILRDVLFGDIWFCSGQSNMVFTMGRVLNSTEELKEAANFTEIRTFQTPLTTSKTPLTDLSKPSYWNLPNSTTLAGFSAVCWLYGKYLYPHINRPIGLIESAWGGTPIEAWSSPEALANCTFGSHRVTRGPGEHSVLWNAMVNPFLPMTIYGALWYQGEANSGRADKYACQFLSMINDWRQKFNKESDGETNKYFPFGFVQLAGNRNDSTYVGGFPDLRWAQTYDYGYVPNVMMENVFMAVAMDLPDFSSPYGTIHPRDKEDVASRLLIAARSVAYGEKSLNIQGPIPAAYITQGKSLVISFEDNTNPIDVRSNTGFEICCSHSLEPTFECPLTTGWIAVNITSHESVSLILDVTSCTGHDLHIRGVRYAWHESPCQFKQCAIYGLDNDLPAPPFKHRL